jgi:drug/metabolite transporter (DMT)-like permease
MTAMDHRPRLAQILAAFAGIYIIWGTTFLALALAIRSIPPFISGGVRFVIAAALMYVWLVTRERRPFQGLKLGGTMLCGVLLSGMGNGFVVWAQQGLPSGIAALFVGALPVITLILDRLFFSKRTPSAQSLLGVTIGLAGIIVLSMNTLSFSASVRPMHIVSVLAAVTGWSLGTLLQRRYAPSHRVLGFTCLQMFAGGVFQLVMSIIDREWGGFEPSHIQLQSVLAVLYLVVFGSLIAVNCYSYLVAHVSAQKVTTYALVNPVIALALGSIVLNERITLSAIVSTVLVLVGVALVLFQRRTPPPAVGSATLAAVEPRN